MRYVSINDINGLTLVTIDQPACGMNDTDFEEFVMAVMLTLANWTGKQLVKHEETV